MLEFIRRFTQDTIPYVKRGNRFFFATPEVLAAEHTVKIAPFSLGLPLGGKKNGIFMPSLPLLTLLAPHTTQKVVITDKAAWLFLCGRNVAAASIVKRAAEGFVLVQNKQDENLGYGQLTKDGVRNLLDRGDYLRRERKSSKAL
ncbi:hypothetical protein HY639_03465 [Candidatus Woesearchaeota archaeon]|nr:hypothetical protein [Candidatus Woesearchaeota archaeon]